MLIKPRKVRATKFESRIRASSRHRQEYTASIASTAVVQGALSVALWIAAVRSYQAVTAHAGDAELSLRLVMPVAFGIGGVWCFVLCLRNLRALRSLWSAGRGRQLPPE